MSLTVAVSGINAIDNPGPGTGIARSLKESGLEVRVVGLAYDSMEPGIYMDWLIDYTYILPWPSCKTQIYLERLSYIINREKVNVIIPALDAELPVYMKLKEKIEALGVRLLIPDYKTFLKRDKTNLPAIADDLGLLVPETRTITALSDIEKTEHDFGYPMMIKGPFYEAYKVQNRTEAQKKFYELSARWGFPLILQQFVEGDEYDLVGLADGAGNDLGHLAIKKMLVTKLGKVWTNVSVINEFIFAAAQKLVEKLNWTGGYELELINRRGTDEFYLIEINPRFPAWLYMAAGCGINLPERLVRYLLGMEYETHSNYQAGRILVRYTGEIIRDISNMEEISVNAEYGKERLS
ncbi:MAG: ATP-grasp domain-containing protein [Fibrobacterota bacterium]